MDKEDSMCECISNLENKGAENNKGKHINLGRYHCNTWNDSYFLGEMSMAPGTAND